MCASSVLEMLVEMMLSEALEISQDSDTSFFGVPQKHKFNIHHLPDTWILL